MYNPTSLVLSKPDGVKETREMSGSGMSVCMRLCSPVQLRLTFSACTDGSPLSLAIELPMRHAVDKQVCRDYCELFDAPVSAYQKEMVWILCTFMMGDPTDQLWLLLGITSFFLLLITIHSVFWCVASHIRPKVPEISVFCLASWLRSKFDPPLVHGERASMKP